MTNAPAIFDAHASDYEALRRRLVPPYDAFYGAAVAALAVAGRPLQRILDLGAGTGLLARAVAAAYPAARLTLFDGAPAMIEQARAGKRDLFARLHLALEPGGVFVNAEQVSAPTALFTDAYASWHERRAFELGTTEQEWAAARERMGLDHLATVDRQLAWLREAGFADADCIFKDRGFAVLVARRSR